MKKRFMSILLILCMMLTLLPTTVLAAGSNTREITVEINHPTYNVWTYSNQGLIKYTVNGGKAVALFDLGYTPIKRTFSVSKGDKVQIIWMSKKDAHEAQVFAYYSDNPATSISDSGRVLGSIALGEASLNADNVFASFTVGDAPSEKTRARTTLPAAPISVWGEPGLYGVTSSEYAYIPFRMRPGGDIIGEITIRTNLKVSAFEGDWAKVRYKGYECYVWAKNLYMMHMPDVVCSPWAKEWLSLEGSYHGIAGKEHGAEDWSKKHITFGDMATLLVNDIMGDKYGDYSVKFTLPYYKKYADSNFMDGIPEKCDSAFAIGRLRLWGVLPVEKVNPEAEVTYAYFTNTLLKLMNYDNKIIHSGFGSNFTKADLSKFNIGGDTRATAKITMEQAKIICQKALCWLTEKDADSGIIQGIYTIRTVLGTEPNQPHIVINGEGKGELSNTKSQNFKVTYKKTVPDNNGYDCIVLNTIQTMDGKYLAISGVPINGSRLITQDKEYLWYIQNRNGGNCIRPYDNIFQPLNASAWKTTDGTPIITWSTVGKEPDKNCKFIFDYVGKASNFSAVPKSTPKPVTPPKPAVTATPSKTSFVINSKPVSVTAAYTINSTNCLQLRAIAIMLNGTAAQFDVGWDGQYAVIEPGKPYSGAVKQTKLQNTTNIRKSSTKFKMNGEVFTFKDARLIDGDTNYIQLREFAQKLNGTASQFNVYWDSATGQAVIQPGVAYTGSAS